MENNTLEFTADCLPAMRETIVAKARSYEDRMRNCDDATIPLSAGSTTLKRASESGGGGGETFRQIFAKNVAHTLATRVEKSLEFSIFLLRTFGIVAGRMIQLHLRFATR